MSMDQTSLPCSASDDQPAFVAAPRSYMETATILLTDAQLRLSPRLLSLHLDITVQAITNIRTWCDIVEITESKTEYLVTLARYVYDL